MMSNNSHQLVLRLLSHGFQVTVLERVPDEGGSDLGDDPAAKVGRFLEAVVRAVAVAVAARKGPHQEVVGEVGLINNKKQCSAADESWQHR